MKRRQHIIRLAILGILTCIPCMVSSKVKMDSLILNRVFNYRRNYAHHVEGVEQNVYMRFLYTTQKRNATMWLIPHMYAIAKGSRDYVGESYNKITFRNTNDYDIKVQVLSGTIPHNRRIMPTLLGFLTPNLYDVLLQNDHLLSPFHRTNRHYYKYSTQILGDGRVKLYFRPRVKSTQLIHGTAIIEMATGRIISSDLNGEYDMISFHTETEQGESGTLSLLPKSCKTDAAFRFLGNRVFVAFDAEYGCPITLPDSIKEKNDRELMAQIRPYELSDIDKYVYDKYDERYTRPDTTKTDSIEHRKRIEQRAWDFIDDNLLSSIRAKSEHVYFRLSPLINPQYLSYSHRRGLSYKINLGAQYTFNPHRYLTLKPTFGYNFKISNLYYTIPLRLTYNPKRDGWLEMVWGNGNRITNSTVLNALEEEHPDSTEFSGHQLEYFDDKRFQITNNVEAFDWLAIKLSLVYHQRDAVNKQQMRLLGKPEIYRSFAPQLMLRFTPWRKGPALTADYERGIRHVLKSDIDYERWEFDASWKRKLTRLRIINMRLGGGFYTNKNSQYFVDFDNFRDNNLPEGWDDDWTGAFQLLASKWYNTSNYYIRGNFSYESPLLFLTWFPVIGRYLEKERFYASTLFIEHTRPYTELGYGFTNRYISVGVFASFLNLDFKEVGCKFTFELFRRW